MQEIIDEILEREGGYVNHPSDKGGPTKYGITQAVARDYGYDGDMEDFPEAIARTIYFSQYITGTNFLKIYERDKAIGELVIDCGVHCGPYRAAATFQELLNIFNKKQQWWEDLKVDGLVGNKTLTAYDEFINKRGFGGKVVFTKAYRCLRGAYYIKIAQKLESQEDFIFGWLANRV